MVHACDHCCTKIENLSVSLGAHEVLKGVHLHVNCKELIAIVGPNGAGKTTLLRAMLGEIPYKGKIEFQIRGSLRKRPVIGYVPQKLDFDPDSPISVSDIMATTVSSSPLWSVKPRALKDKIKSILQQFSADHLVDRTLGELSGGELQRVLLAMAMTPNPDILLLDEPISGVDAKGLALFYKIARGLIDKFDIAILLVTHDLAGVAPHADRMILLNKSVIASGHPKDVLADKKLIEALGPSLWNISKLPEFSHSTNAEKRG